MSGGEHHDHRGYVADRRDPDTPRRLQWRTRALDPTTARRSAGHASPQPTWYVGDRLLLDAAAPAPDDAKEWLRPLNRVAKPLGLRVEIEQETYDDLELLDEAAQAGGFGTELRDHLRRVMGTSAVLVRRSEGQLPDGWDLLAAVRALRDQSAVNPAALGDLPAPHAVALDHVIVPGAIGGATGVQPQPFTATQPFIVGQTATIGHPVLGQTATIGHPATIGHTATIGHPVTGLAEYAVQGWGGRQPVAWTGPAPRGTIPAVPGDPFRGPGEQRRPVVALMDTGVGPHPWFGLEGEKRPAHVAWTEDDRARPDVVVRHPRVLGRPMGLCPDPATRYEDTEIGGVSIDPLTGPLDPVAGHGTFMAGLVHQACPDAVILAPRVYAGSGVVPERDLLRSLRRLLLWHLLGLAGVTGYSPVDVAVLSLGYYHERPEDAAFDLPLGTVVDELRRWGVLVVCSTGNDGQVRETYPAAFAPRLDRRTEPPTPRAPLSPTEPPVLAVGARNPDGTTALFSNDGDWVTCLRPGASLISTAPITIDGVVAPTRHMPELFSRGARATIDPEGFQGGFAVWSGTSFAAPVLAGELAALLLEIGIPAPTAPVAGGDPDRCLRVWRAVTAATGLTYEPAGTSPGGAVG
ncbi:S8/S53 family peptidase [Xylanimonas protaetiae]|uniref:Peptidase S8/S53 domain-containing protein n=1 Tax=Xylanimonas protaetiae TaxID=2509457 RepID=A0A4P6F3A5_9MICO|nr:S8/S53 family peptidase [Xylanimonas protaetiae]QAY70072.1 hypothetical protein ET471_08515 [Xylanimonas protaetiae]